MSSANRESFTSSYPVWIPFVSLGRYIPKYFILFVTMVNGIVSLISLSVFSLVVYRNARNFCVLILYLVTLLYSLISSSNFLVVSKFSFLCRGSCHLKTVRVYFSFPIWILFVSSLICRRILYHLSHKRSPYIMG